MYFLAGMAVGVVLGAGGGSVAIFALVLYAVTKGK